MAERIRVNGNAGEVGSTPQPPTLNAQPGSGPSWDYAPAPETTRVEISPRYGHFINGAFVEPSEGGQMLTLNPASDEVLSEVALGTEADVERGVRAAREALPTWAGLPGRERGKYLYRIARRIQERARELAILETMDGGKPIRESRDIDVPLAAAHFFYYAGWADKLRFAIPGAARDPEPVGVCAQIIPWNFPLLMAAWKLAPALACGNTCVLKPAETTPLTALRLAQLLLEVGLPRGVVNVLTGDGRTGQTLAEHPDVDKIAFTGSTEVGKKIARIVARRAGGMSASRGPDAGSHLDASQRRVAPEARPVRLTLELGGKSPNIIFEDASIDQAIEGVIAGIYFNQGHVCCAGSRLFVQESIEEDVVRRLAHRLRTLRVGDPLDKNTDIGAINSRQQLATIRRYLDAGVGEGATLHVSGELNGLADSWQTDGQKDGDSADTTPMPPEGTPGNWCRPCFFTGVEPSHAIAREEIFGPVLSVMTFRTPEEAITRANSTPYGLAAGVWTDKGSKIFDIARRLKAGIVWCNTYNRFDPASPFGGYKESGFGREGGMHGLRAYLQ